MVLGIARQWRLVERWSPTVLVVAGSLLVGHTGMLAVQAFTGLTPPPDVFGPSGHLVALAGLMGLYPTLADRTPRVALVAGAAAAVALGGWALLTITRFLAVLGFVASASDVLPAVIVMAMFGATVLTYGLFGAATVRVDEISRVVGPLALAPGALLVVAIVGSATVDAVALLGFVIGGGLSLSVLALGFTLRTRVHPVGSRLPAGEVTTG